MCYKLDVAKNVITELLTSIQDVRVGLMVFNSSNEGGHIVDVIDSIDNNRAQLISDVNAIEAQTYTPLAETLYEAGRYFKGEHYFDPNPHASPIQFSCQKNYVIMMTDGKSTAG